MAAAADAPSSLNDRFAAYRPWIDRLMFGLALLGLIVVVHLGVQQQRGFAEGCFGFASLDAAAPAFNCAAVVGSAAGTLLGVSNLVWGGLFYGLVAVLSFAAFVTPQWRVPAKQGRAVLVTGGVLYSAYLVYVQVAQLNALCALCLVSAGIVALLFGLMLFSLFSTHRATASMSDRSTKREFMVLVYLTALAGLVIGADVLYFQNAEAASPSARQAAAVADTMQVAEGCFYDPEQQPVQNFGQLVDFQDPAVGNAQSPVTIVEFFDPNCPHCKTMHAVMEKAIAQYGDQARFVFQPLPLWRFSVPQIEALYAAQQEGKFIEMLEAQYARQQQGGLSMTQLQAIAKNIGMNPEVLASRVESGTFRSRVMAQRQEAIDIGVNSTPTLVINGRFIDNQSRTLRCIGAFIQAAKQGASAGASNSAAGTSG